MAHTLIPLKLNESLCVGFVVWYFHAYYDCFNDNAFIKVIDSASSIDKFDKSWFKVLVSPSHSLHL